MWLYGKHEFRSQRRSIAEVRERQCIECKWSLCNNCCKEFSTYLFEDSCHCLDMYLLIKNDKLAEIRKRLSKFLLTMIRQDAETHPITEYVTQVKLYNDLSDWYSDSPDDLEREDITARGRLTDILNSIPIQYRDMLKSKNIYVRPPTEPSNHNTKQCPKCTVELIRHTDSKIVICNVCKIKLVWETMSLIHEQPTEVLGNYSNFTSLDKDISNIIHRLWNKIPKMVNVSMYMLYIMNIIAVDNILDKAIVSRTMGYTTDELIEKIIINEVISKSVYIHQLILNIINRDLNINRARCTSLCNLITALSKQNMIIGSMTECVKNYEEMNVNYIR